MSKKDEKYGVGTYLGILALALCAIMVLLIPIFWLILELWNLAVRSPGDDGFGLTPEEYQTLQRNDDPRMPERVLRMVHQRFHEWKTAHSRVWGARVGMLSIAGLLVIFPDLHKALIAPFTNPPDLMEAWVGMSLGAVPTLIVAGIGYLVGSQKVDSLANNRRPPGTIQALKSHFEAAPASNGQVEDKGSTGLMTSEGREDMQQAFAESTCMLAGYILQADGPVSEGEAKTAAIVAESCTPEGLQMKQRQQYLQRLIVEGSWSAEAAQAAASLLTSTTELRDISAEAMARMVRSIEPESPEKEEALRQVLTWLGDPHGELDKAGRPSERGPQHIGTENQHEGNSDRSRESKLLGNLVLGFGLVVAHIMWSDGAFCEQDRTLARRLINDFMGLFDEYRDGMLEPELIFEQISKEPPEIQAVKEGCVMVVAFDENGQQMREMMMAVAVHSPGRERPKRQAFQEVLMWLDTSPNEIATYLKKVEEEWSGDEPGGR